MNTMLLYTLQLTTQRHEEYFLLLPTYIFKQYASTVVAILGVIQTFSPIYFILRE